MRRNHKWERHAGPIPEYVDGAASKPGPALAGQPDRHAGAASTVLVVVGDAEPEQDDDFGFRFPELHTERWTDRQERHDDAECRRDCRPYRPGNVGVYAARTTVLADRR